MNANSAVKADKHKRPSAAFACGLLQRWPMTHAHDLSGQAWPFADPDNMAVFCCRHVLEGAPILYVTHHEEDGAWQFLCGEGGHESEHARVVCLGCMATRDRALLPLADLPLGWSAERENAHSGWVRRPNSSESDATEDVG